MSEYFWNWARNAADRIDGGRVYCGNLGCDLCRDYFAAIAARRAGTGNTDPVHEGAGPKDIAQ